MIPSADYSSNVDRLPEDEETIITKQHHLTGQRNQSESYPQGTDDAS